MTHNIDKNGCSKMKESCEVCGADEDLLLADDGKTVCFNCEYERQHKPKFECEEIERNDIPYPTFGEYKDCVMLDAAFRAWAVQMTASVNFLKRSNNHLTQQVEQLKERV